MIFKVAAFTSDPQGGNPAGVWIGSDLPSTSEMQSIAQELGFSETAFIGSPKEGKRTIRYYSPEAEVPFCGHATIASGFVLGNLEGADEYIFDSLVGSIPVNVQLRDGELESSLISVEPKQKSVDPLDLLHILELLHWKEGDLDSEIPPSIAFAGAWHLVLAVSSRERLANLQYQLEETKQFMLERSLTTLQLIWRESENTFHVRNPFPVGGVYEDPATGAAAAALGGYLRSLYGDKAPDAITILQGEDMGRPSRISVDIPQSGGIHVRGNSVFLTEA